MPIVLDLNSEEKQKYILCTSTMMYMTQKHPKKVWPCSILKRKFRHIMRRMRIQQTRQGIIEEKRLKVLPDRLFLEA